MNDSMPSASSGSHPPVPPPPSAEATPEKPRRALPVWALPAVAAAVALTVGLGAGAIIGGSGDVRETPEYVALAAERDAAAAELAEVKVGREEAQGRYAALAESLKDIDDRTAALVERGKELDARSADLDDRESGLDDREKAVGTAEKKAAEKSFDDGIWTVGEDIKPGRYKVTEAVGGSCYWSITRTGSNGDDIIENDIVTGGRPAVVLRTGQDFTSNRCGTWMLQD
ncbi:hypothetical protein [Sanguibacter massiliensis]|uniref:hypothetical protein n=1 Tax=Sanguibacter massiliensis TaxID=1973217 RepID=UPI000C829057|nr:hypothetical protein [Sanguibacter massiliensis]